MHVLPYNRRQNEHRRMCIVEAETAMPFFLTNKWKKCSNAFDSARLQPLFISQTVARLDSPSVYCVRVCMHQDRWCSSTVIIHNRVLSFQQCQWLNIISLFLSFLSLRPSHGATSDNNRIQRYS